MFFRNSFVYLALCASLCTGACTSKPEQKSNTGEQNKAVSAPVPEEENDDEKAKRVEDMSDDELQMACFDGSQAACDLLGH